MNEWHIAVAFAVTMISGVLVIPGVRQNRRYSPPVARYIPFDAETYLPVTPGNIDQWGQKLKLTSQLSHELSMLLKQTRPAKSIDRKMIRLAFSEGQHRTLVDQKGHTLFVESGKTGRLPARTFSRIASLLERFEPGP